jgi:hypothetical protein
MPLGQGEALPDVKTTTTQTTAAPGYYTNYLSNLAQAGQTATSTPADQLVAGFTNLQNQGFNAIPTAAEAYKPGLTAAQQTAATAAQGITPQAIQGLMNPYTSNVVDEMARLQQQNVQRNLMPTLKAGFVGTGGLGGQRYANALGQSAADLQSNLTGQQYGALSAGYKDALQAAIQDAQLKNQAAQVQGTLAGKEQELGLTGAESMLKGGAQQQALEQAKIEAPLKTAANSAALLRGYNIPTSTVQNYTGPMPGAYAASPLQQIAGLATLFASGAGGSGSAATNFKKFISDVFKNTGGTSTGGGGDGTSTGGGGDTGGGGGGNTGGGGGGDQRTDLGGGYYIDDLTGIIYDADGNQFGFGEE